MIRARCEVLSSRAAGAYQSVTLVAPEIAEKARPGQFVEVGMPEGRRFFLRRPFFIHQASRRGGWAGTVELVVDRAGAGTSWLADAKAHEFVDMIGPLGKGFGFPKPTNCLLLAEGYGAAPLYFLAEELRARGKRVDMIVAASTQDRLFKPIEGKRLAHTITVVTEDGSVGERGTMLDVLPGVIDRSDSHVVYATCSRHVLRSVAELCRERRIPAQVVLEELMACGLGLCYTCVVPIMRPDGKGFDHVRACIDGPAFNAGRVVWDRWAGDDAPSRGRQKESTPPEGLPIEPGSETVSAAQPWPA